jgi:hypothetical protein
MGASTPAPEQADPGRETARVETELDREDRFRTGIQRRRTRKSGHLYSLHWKPSSFCGQAHPSFLSLLSIFRHANPLLIDPAWQRPDLLRVKPPQIRQFPGKKVTGPTQTCNCDLLHLMQCRLGRIIVIRCSTFLQMHRQSRRRRPFGNGEQSLQAPGLLLHITAVIQANKEDRPAELTIRLHRRMCIATAR